MKSVHLVTIPGCFAAPLLLMATILDALASQGRPGYKIGASCGSLVVTASAFHGHLSGARVVLTGQCPLALLADSKRSRETLESWKRWEEGTLRCSAHACLRAHSSGCPL